MSKKHDDYLEPDKFPHWYHNPNSTAWDGNPWGWWFGDKRHFRPWYDNQADYNTNAKSYYDYLGYRIRMFDVALDKINEVLARNLTVSDSDTIDLELDGNWQAGSTSIDLTAHAILSSMGHNAIKVYKDGLYVYDFRDTINDLENRVDNLEDKVDNINDKIDGLEDKLDQLQDQNADLANALEKIIERMTNQGAWNGGLAGDFTPNQSIATGNINVYGVKENGNYYIKTHTGSNRTGDMVQGLD